MRRFFLIIILFLSSKLSAQLSHSHNDYEQKLPFEAAYNLGFYSIEADLYLKDNDIFAAHDWDKIKFEQTFKILYLNPLLTKINENNAFPYPNKKPLTLMLDLKKNGREIAYALALTRAYAIRPYSFFTTNQSQYF